jgi:gas vesicle protein
MAQMRVKDQDLIVEQVVKKIEANELDKFKARDDVQDIQSAIEVKIEIISMLIKQYKELEETIKTDQKELKELVQDFHEDNGLEYSGYNSVNQGIELNGVNYGVAVPTYELVWKLAYSQQRELSTKLRLQTMSGDFDVYQLIDELTAEFSN